MQRHGEIRVLMDFGASGRHHSLYDELLEAPPQGVRYVVPRMPVSRLPRPVVGLYQKLRGGLEGRLDLAAVARGLNRAGAAGYDVAHLANHLDAVEKPFVVDFEQAISFLHAHTSAETVEADFARVRASCTRIMEAPNCKFLLPWTEAGAETLRQAFPSKRIEEKTRVVRLAMRVPKNHAPLKHQNFRVLFLGTSNLKGDWNFYLRGGRTMLRVFEKFARNRKDAELVMTGEVPERERPLLGKIRNYSEEGLVSKERLEEIFRTSDALLFPSYTTPGLAFLEAMRYHIPIVATDAWANREIVKHNVNGIVAEFSGLRTKGKFGLSPGKKEFAEFEQGLAPGRPEEELARGLEKLYASASLRARLGNAGFSMVEKGEFSIGTRNRLLRGIYEECIA
jgi:glycosyltransferase involved in cell wall biosynthesis